MLLTQVLVYVSLRSKKTTTTTTISCEDGDGDDDNDDDADKDEFYLSGLRPMIAWTTAYDCLVYIPFTWASTAEVYRISSLYRISNLSP